ncbi:MAG: MarR family transcriptional regulator [Pseudomonadales bacterium]|nr:MarR family transcriptional regulator [Pseudomonadales bacterium]
MHKKTQTSLVYLLINNGKQAKRIAAQALQAQDVSTQNLPLSLLSQIDKEGNSLAELTSRMQCSKQETSRQVQLAESKGWVVLQASAKDKRAKIVTLTPFAKQQMNQGMDFYADLEKKLLQGLSATEKQQILAVQKKMQKLLKEFELN